MAEETKVSMYVTKDCLVVPIQEELHMESLHRIQEDILNRVYEKSIKGVIIDVTGVAIIDRLIAQKIFDSARMASLLGAETVITGLRPGTVSSLVDLEFDQGDVTTAINLEGGFRLLEPIIRNKKEGEEAVEPEPELDQEQEDGKTREAEIDEAEEQRRKN